MNDQDGGLKTHDSVCVKALEDDYERSEHGDEKDIKTKMEKRELKLEQDSSCLDFKIPSPCSRFVAAVQEQSTSLNL